jgi:two-component sensor histidine kinase/CheY-like chemotaxis protein
MIARLPARSGPRPSRPVKPSSVSIGYVTAAASTAGSWCAANPFGTAKAGSSQWFGAVTDVHDLITLQERQSILMAELQHRTRNLMAVVETVMRKSLASSRDMADAKGRIAERFGALSRVQGLLSRRSEGARVTFDALLRDELGAHVPLPGDGDTSHVTLEGPPGVELRSLHVQILALGLHELTTNAVKYGALAYPDGRLAVRWRVRERRRSRRCLVVDWRETGVPTSLGPKRASARRRLRPPIDRARPALSAWRQDRLPVRAGRRSLRDRASPCRPPNPGVLRIMTKARQPFRILVVEDEYLLADALADALIDMGAQVVGPIGQLSQAMFLVETTPIDGAVLDINLHGEMVFPLAQVLATRGVPFVFATGYGRENIPVQFAHVPVLAKPIDVGLLEGLLDRTGG